MSAAVEEAITWAEEHQHKVREIVEQATQLATRILNRDGVDCYFLQVLQGVANLSATLTTLPNDARDPEWNKYDSKP